MKKTCFEINIKVSKPFEGVDHFVFSLQHFKPVVIEFFLAVILLGFQCFVEALLDENFQVVNKGR